MTDANGASPAPGFSQSSRIPIAQISPTKENISQSVIYATVSLLWPYSSSTKSLGLLLAEPDFRLRRSNGQVKVVFNGHIAESVAASKIGIGDDVQLCLNGSRFVSNEAATQTPGKGVTWDLHFDDRVRLEVFRNSERLATVKADPSSSPLPSIRVTSPTPVTPTPKNNSAIDGVASAITGQSWQSPAFVGRSRSSFGVLVDSAYDPFAEEDGYVPGKGRKRARFSMSDWRVVDEPEIPGENDMPVDWFHMFDEEDANGSPTEDTTAHADQVAAGCPQPSNGATSDPGDAMDISEPTPANDVNATTEFSTASDQHVEASKDDVFRLPDRQNIPSLRSHFPIDTPRLHPIPSPGLPIPSPLVTTTSNQQGYFGSAGFASHSQPGPVSAIFSQGMQQQDTNAAHVLSQTSLTGLFGHVETAPEGSHLGQDTETSGVSVASEAIQFSEITAIDEEVIEQPPQVVEATTSRESENAEVEVEDIDAHEEGDVQDLDHVSQQEDISEGSQDDGEEAESRESEFDDEHEGHAEEERQRQAIEVGSNAQGHRTSSMAESFESEDDMESEAESVDEEAHAPDGQRIDLTTEQRHLSEENDTSSRDEEDDEIIEDEDEEEDEDDDEDEMDDEPALYGAGRGRPMESMDEDEYDEEEEYESEYESDQMSVENDNRPPPPPKTVHPEVIVLDSDSEDDTPPSRATVPAEQREPNTRDGHHSHEEESVSGESYSGSEAEDWSEADAPRQHGRVESEVDDQQDEAELVEESDEDENDDFELGDEPQPGAEAADASREDEYVESELEGERQSEAEVVDARGDEHMKTELEEEHQPEAELVEESSEDEQGKSELEEKHQPEAEAAEPPQQPKEASTLLEEEEEVDIKPEVAAAEDQPQEAENVEDKWPEDEHMEDHPMDDHEHVEDEQIVEAHPDQNPNVEETDIGVLPDDNASGYDDRVQNIHNDVDNDDVAMPAPHQEFVGHGALGPAIDHPHATAEPVQHGIEMAIDPELFNLDPVLGDNYEGNQTQQRHDEHTKPTAEELPIQIEQEKEDRAGLTMDGSSTPPPALQDANDSSAVLPTSLQHGQPPIITPEPSQSVDVNNDTHMELAVTEMPPTPVHTQEASTQEKEHLQSLQAAEPIPDAATELATAPEEPSPDEVPDNTEVAQVSEEGPHESVEVSAHEPEAPTTPGNQSKQTHITIDDDDSIDTIDSVHLVSVDRNYPGLRSKLSYFAPLATLIDHFNTLIDTISVVSEIHPVIQGTKRKDYMITLGLTDPSMAGTTLNAQLIRPWKAALPSPEEGDSILLRNFHVRSYDHSMILVSGETSSWAVFSRSKVDAQVDGPPVEYGAEEQTHATGLRKWYQEAGMAMVADFQLQASIEREGSPASSAILSDSGSLDSVLRDQRADSSVSTRSSRRSRKSHRRITIHELRDGTRYTEVGSPSGKDSIHELRDGTVYAHQ